MLTKALRKALLTLKIDCFRNEKIAELTYHPHEFMPSIHCIISR